MTFGSSTSYWKLRLSTTKWSHWSISSFVKWWRRWRRSTRCWQCLGCTLSSTTLAMVSTSRGVPTSSLWTLPCHWCARIILRPMPLEWACRASCHEQLWCSTVAELGRKCLILIAMHMACIIIWSVSKVRESLTAVSVFQWQLVDLQVLPPDTHTHTHTLFFSFPLTARMTFQLHRLHSHLLQVLPTTLKSPPGMSLAAHMYTNKDAHCGGNKFHQYVFYYAPRL